MSLIESGQMDFTNNPPVKLVLNKLKLFVDDRDKFDSVSMLDLYKDANDEIYALLGVKRRDIEGEGDQEQEHEQENKGQIYEKDEEGEGEEDGNVEDKEGEQDIENSKDKEINNEWH